MKNDRPHVLLACADLSLGGAQRMVTDLACTINAEDFEVSVLAMSKPLETTLEHQLLGAGIPLYHANKNPGIDLSLLPRISRVLERVKPDIIHSHTRALRYVWPAALPRRVPMIHTVHNTASKEAGKARAVHSLAFFCGVVPVAISETLADDVRSAYWARSYPVVDNGIRLDRHAQLRNRDEVRSSLDLDTSDFVLINVGRLSEQKNQNLLLEAFQGVRTLQKSAKLLMVGDGPDRTFLESRIEALELTNSVILAGSREDVPDLLNACDAFVLSSRWEGNPLCVMEAMASGLPVVATDVGAVRQLVRHRNTGLLVPPGDVEKLEKAMMALFADRDLRNRMGRAAAALAHRRFGVDRMTEKYQEIYRSLL